MSTTPLTITQETARHVLWMFGHPGGQQPGRFTQHLAAAIECADRKHAAILAEAFPDLAGAILLAKHHEDGIDQLREFAAPRCPRCGDKDGPFTSLGFCETCARPVPLGGVM